MYTSNRPWDRVCTKPLHQDTCFSTVLAVTLLLLAHRVATCFVHRHCISPASWSLWEVFVRTHDTIGWKKKSQSKSLQVMDEVMEKCTKAYGECDISLVAWILLKRPTQVNKKDAGNGWSNGEMYTSLWRVWHLISSVDPADPLKWIKKMLLLCGGIKKCMGNWEESMPSQPFLLLLYTLSGRVLPCFMSNLDSWMGRKGNGEGTLYETSFNRSDVAWSKQVQETPYHKTSAACVFLPDVLHQPAQVHLIPWQRRHEAPCLLPLTPLSPVP